MRDLTEGGRVRLMSPRDRFLSKLTPTKDGCLVWTGSTNQKGYGRFSINYKKVAVHRFSYETYVGEIPEDLYVLHSCDVRACVLPSHLRLGTQKENMEDRDKSGNGWWLNGYRNSITGWNERNKNA